MQVSIWQCEFHCMVHSTDIGGEGNPVKPKSEQHVDEWRVNSGSNQQSVIQDDTP